jgi:hypothetical protein
MKKSPKTNADKVLEEVKKERRPSFMQVSSGRM